MQCLVAQSCLTLWNPLDCSPPGSSVHGDSPGKNTGVGCHALLQGIFPTQGSNPCLQHCGWTFFFFFNHLSHQGFHSGSPEWHGRQNSKMTTQPFHLPWHPLLLYRHQFSSVQLLSHDWLFVTLWTVPRQASLSITNFWSFLKLMSVETVMLSNHLILCRPLLLPPSVSPSIRVFSNESVLCIRWPK